MLEHFVCQVGAPCRNTLHVSEHFSYWVKNTMSEHFTCWNTFHVGSAPHVGTLFILDRNTMAEHFRHWVGTLSRNTLHVSEHFSYWVMNTMSENFTCRNTFHVGVEHLV